MAFLDVLAMLGDGGEVLREENAEAQRARSSRVMGWSA
jgi:hypothetical protein